MLFNSIEFAVFLPVVFLLYWFVFNNNLKVQNIFILVVSYVFYGWWDWRFLSLIAFSSAVDFFVGQRLGQEEQLPRRKMLLTISVVVNLGFLGVFKYYNFFAENLAEAFTLLGTPLDPGRLSIILPVGISFYTFQTLSYTIDVYRKKLEPSSDFAAFFAYVSFFPQLVAGPIERATNLLPQFYRKRQFDYSQAADGMRQVLWGLFKKVVIADNCAFYADQIFSNYESYTGLTLVFGALMFAFQIYGDFSGYSDIAIGTARLFGFSLMRNFAFPYFSRDIAEFWRRWHISLSTWFKDYLYIPLGGSRGGKWQQVRNTFIIFIVSGFWHGAEWTFLFWGFLNACYFLPLLLRNRNRQNLDVAASGKIFPSLREAFSILITFGLTTFAWIFFRAEKMGDALGYVRNMFRAPYLDFPSLSGQIISVQLFLAILGVFLLTEWLQRHKQHAGNVEEFRGVVRQVFYVVVIAVILLYGNFSSNAFIYFQF